VPDELEPVEPGVELGLVVSVELGDEGDVEGDGVAGDDVVGGDADGERSPGRSLVRGAPLSVQAVASVATSARAEMLSSALFMNAPPDGVRSGSRNSKASATECVMEALFVECSQ
jgi:hypothetical protein